MTRSRLTRWWDRSRRDTGQTLGVMAAVWLASGFGCAAAGRHAGGLVAGQGEMRPTMRLAGFQVRDSSEPPEPAVESQTAGQADEVDKALRSQTGLPEKRVVIDPQTADSKAGGSEEEGAPMIDEDEKRHAVEIEPDGEEEPDGAKSPRVARSGYTAPSAAVRNLSLATSVGAINMAPEQGSAAEVAAESMIISAQGAVGQLGLTAPPTMVAGAVTSRSGLGRGPATGLGFAAMGNNLFTLRANPLSGANGRCADLARAGFFGGDRHACERSFGR